MACDWFKAIAPPFPEFVTDKPWIVTGKLFDILKFHWYFLPFLKLGLNPTEFCQSLFFYTFFEINKNCFFFRFLARGLKSTQPSFTKQADSTDKYRKAELLVLFFLKLCKFLSKNAQIAIEINNWLPNLITVCWESVL